MEYGKPMESIDLSNGERLDIHDLSRKISKDAWMVSLVFRIVIDLGEKDFNDIPALTDKKVRESLGDQIVYEVKRERNFIMDKDKQMVLKDVKDSFLKMNMKYLSHPLFAVKYAVKKYHEKNRY